MAKGISIGVLADTKSFAGDVQRGVVQPLEDAADQLKALGTQGDKAGDELEAGFTDAQAATNKYERALQDAIGQQEKVARSSKTTNRAVTDNIELSSREQRKIARETFHEIGNEAKQNAAESFSSFTGSGQSFLDALQGTFGGVIASLPPQLAFLGAAGAAAIGLISGSMQSADTKSQEWRDDVAELTQALIDAGNDGTIPIDQIVKSLQKLAVESDPSKTNLDKLFDTARRAGSSAKDLAVAYAGETDGLKQLLAQQRKKLQADHDSAAAYEKSLLGVKSIGPEQKAEQARLEGLADAQRDYVNYLDQASSKAAAAKKADEEYAAAGGPQLQLKKSLIDQVNTAYDDAAGSVDDYVDSESGLLNTDRYIAAMQAKQKALQDYQTGLLSSGLSAEAKTFLESQGADAAATLLAGYESGSDAQKQALAAIWTEAGKTSSGAYVGALTKGMPATVPGPTVVPQLDLGTVNGALARLGSTKVVIDAELHLTARGERIL